MGEKFVLLLKDLAIKVSDADFQSKNGRSYPCKSHKVLLDQK